MCIAIVKTSGAKIPDEYLEESFDNNRDGAGIAYAHNGKLYVCKGIFDKKKFIETVRKAEKVAEGAMLIHCRIGTHGLKDKNNCHPHIISNKCVLIHNGILNIDIPEDSNESDTIWFIKKYLKPLSRDFMKDDAICELIEMAIRSGNKFALLNNKGEYRILNEQAGHWEKGVWYSNYSYKPPVRLTPKVRQENTSWNELPLFNQQKEIEVDEEKLINKIRMLSNFEFLEIGMYPVVDLATLRILPEDSQKIFDTTRYRYLDDLSETAYEEYCAEIELRGLINEIADAEEMNSSKEVWKNAI